MKYLYTLIVQQMGKKIKWNNKYLWIIPKIPKNNVDIVDNLINMMWKSLIFPLVKMEIHRSVDKREGSYIQNPHIVKCFVLEGI